MAKGGPWACKEEDYLFVRRACKPDRFLLGPVLLGAGPNNHTQNKLVVGLETQVNPIRYVKEQINLRLHPRGPKTQHAFAQKCHFVCFCPFLADMLFLLIDEERTNPSSDNGGKQKGETSDESEI